MAVIDGKQRITAVMDSFANCLYCFIHNFDILKKASVWALDRFSKESGLTFLGHFLYFVLFGAFSFGLSYGLAVAVGKGECEWVAFFMFLPFSIMSSFWFICMVFFLFPFFCLCLCFFPFSFLYHKLKDNYEKLPFSLYILCILFLFLSSLFIVFGPVFLCFMTFK